ncbi:MAG: hypothetical protein JJU28_16345 [Cyclobacteriaceae bacterium]|nr:hypothetical protein [Cyclobacteriaceae bacterium]
MAKKTIAIISVLKPLEDPRHFEKMALSIGQTNKYEINIIGFGIKKISTHQNIHFHPLGKFGRLHPKRWLARVKTLLILLKLKPEVIIANTHELLIVMILNKILFGSKIIYDVQENYYRNIKYGQVFPAPLNIILSYIVRCKEKLLFPFLDYCFLAERSYYQEMNFLQSKSIILENKYKPGIRPKSRNYTDKNNLIFAYTGTISVNYGIFDALNFISTCRQYHKDAQLIIHGYCADTGLRKHLLEKCSRMPYIKLITGDFPQPHEDILNTLNISDFALLPYHLGPEIRNCIPTKLYECLALRVPVIIRENVLWKSLCDPCNAALYTDFNHLNDFFPIKFSELTLYNSLPGEEILWSSEEKKLIEALFHLTIL